MHAADKGSYHGLPYRQRKRDGLTFSEIVINNGDRILAIVVDVDRTDANTVWMDADIAVPNFITISKRGHAHYVWLLDDERGGTIWPKTQLGAVRYADAIQRELTRAVGGDLKYAWQTNPTHNPTNENYKTIVIRQQAYRLDEIAIGLELIDSAPRRRWNGFQMASECEYPLVVGSRNDGVFRRLMSQATRVMEYHREAESYEAEIAQIAYDLNNQCDVPMDHGEVAEIVASVLRYNPFMKKKDTRSARRKAKRAAEGRTWEARIEAFKDRKTQAIDMRKSGMLIREIAAEMHVDTRTIERYCQGISPKPKDPIIAAPIQGYTGPEAGSEDLEAPIPGSNVVEISEKIRVRAILAGDTQILPVGDRRGGGLAAIPDPPDPTIAGSIPEIEAAPGRIVPIGAALVADRI